MTARTYGRDMEKMIIAGILLVPGYQNDASKFHEADFADLNLMELFRHFKEMRAQSLKVTIISLLRYAVKADGEEHSDDYASDLIEAIQTCSGIPHAAFPRSPADVFAAA